MMRFSINIIIFFSVFLCFVCITAIQGPRGTDQYWYMAAAKSIAEKHEARSNTIYPTQALKGEVIKNPFVHNIPPVYFAGALAFIFGPYFSWVVFNLLNIVLINLLVYQLLKQRANEQIASSLIGIFILFPLNLWFATQALSEAFLGVLVMLGIYLFYNKNNFKNKLIYNLLIVIIIVTLTICRTNFILFIVALPFIYLKYNDKRKNFIILIGLFALYIILYHFFKVLLPTASESRLIEILISYIPDNSPSMPGFYGSTETDFEFFELFKILFLKTVKAFKTQFFSINPLSIFSYGIFNLLILVSFIGYFTSSNKKELRFYLLVSMLLFFVHFATAVLFQNQFRYLFPFYPVLGLNSVLIYKDKIYNNTNLLKSKLMKISIFGVIVLFVVLNIYVFHTARIEAHKHQKFRTYIQNIVGNIIPENENIWLEKHSPIFSFIMFPRDILNTNNSFTDSDLIKMIDNVNPNWLICHENSELPARLVPYGYIFEYKTFYINDIYGEINNRMEIYKFNSPR